ncbi:MAG: N-carbamoyl-D-amino-acid hydrolase [Mesorhizobium sp. 61-13]|nr:N-carbamoyl-D-amino-acid hydrolase [Mesorhizobium sp.]OJU52838.1 MAG: N-carbamoyl-D-amino-acid hydrolase [Mesorhizobium sp. 61-13]
MTRTVTVGAAQLGPIARDEPRSSAVARMIALLEEAKAKQCQFVVFPELALTTFFPRWYFEQQADIDAFFEKEMPSAETQPLFDRSRELGVGFYLGFAELADENGKVRHYNTAILVDQNGEIVSRYRKVHLPGHVEHEPWRAFQHLEKRYFEPGVNHFEPVEAFGGRVSLALCNDRRWPEIYREAALRGSEIMLIGYNTPAHYPPAPEHDHLQCFHNHLVMQAGAYQNGMWVVGVAKAGIEEGCSLIGQSCIIAPTGEIVAMCGTLGDELVTYDCDLDRCREIRDNVFNFSLHRRPDMYPLLSFVTK